MTNNAADGYGTCRVCKRTTHVYDGFITSHGDALGSCAGGGQVPSARSFRAAVPCPECGKRVDPRGRIGHLCVSGWAAARPIRRKGNRAAARQQMAGNADTTADHVAAPRRNASERS